MAKKSDAEPQDEAAQWLQEIAAQGDKAAFVALFNSYAPRVKAYLRRQGVDGAQADDMTQDVMFQIWNRASQFDPAKARPSTWIFTIARNRFIDQWRQQKSSLVDFNDPAALPDIPYEQTHGIEHEKESQNLHAVISELSSEQRAMIEESYFQERSHRMIAKARKIPLGTVKSRLRLALNHLRDHLRQKIGRAT